MLQLLSKLLVVLWKSSSSESLSDKGSELKKSFDAVVFDVLKVTPEEYAVSFWVVREILHAQTLKIRAEVLSHYIKTAKASIYLSDLTYIDSAYPSTGSILENEQRSNLMNNILRIISDLQQSCEYDIPILPHVQKYLNSVQYIEELQKFVEDDNYNFIHKMNTAEFKSATFPNAGPRHLLDDSVMEPHAPSRGQAESSTLSSGISIDTHLTTCASSHCYSSAESEDLAVHLYPGAVTIQGVLRRKTLLKEGKKPTVASWTKYWAALCGTQLFYYAAKSLKATERKHFKSTSNKNVCVVGWMVMMADDPEHPDLFLLTDSEKGNSYKFQAGSRMNAMLWFKHLSAACQSNRQQVSISPPLQNL
ncbi:Ras-specific guanine nucleotide-releasing factor RalGPS2 [Cricetulus griseus]|nr:Ras-specific guanine nucleotide-releasing factor RalGPS2 [Cricetulus griseus]